MATFAPPPLSRYRSPSVHSSSHHPPRPLDAPDLFPLLNSLKLEPAFQAALAQQQSSTSKSKAPSRKPSKRRNASGAASVTSGAATGRKDEEEGWARVPRGGREMRNGDLLAELYRDVGRQKMVGRSDVGKQRASESRGESPAALFARSTGWEGGGSLPTIRSSQRGSTEAPRRLPHTADLFSMLENPPAPVLPPRDSVYSARPNRASPYHSTATASARRPLPPIPARSVPDLPTTLPPGAAAVETFHYQNTASYPVHSPLPIAPPLRHSSSFLGDSPLGSPPRTGSSFSHAVTQLKRMLSRASNRSMRSRRMSAGAPSTLSRTRTMSSSFTANLVSSPAEMSSFQYPQVTTFTSPPTSPDSNATRPDSRPSLTQSSPRPRPRTVFLARDDIDRDLPSSIEARKALLEILREGPPSKSPINRPPLRSVNSLPLPSRPTESASSPQPAERLTSIDEPRYWTFDNMASRSASNLPQDVREEEQEREQLGFDSAPRPRPIPATPRGRSESGYYSYGSRWDWDTVEQKEEVEKRSRILKIWKGWVKERKGRGSAGNVVVVD